jgi:hypothetical protein
MNSLTLFVILQVADIASTLLFLAIGVQEGNPAVRMLLHLFSPVVSLALVKVFGIVFGTVWYLRGNKLTKINIAFLVLVAWNILAIWRQISLMPVVLSSAK